MSKWFRLEAAAVRHPKVAGLSDKNFRWWVKLLAVAAENGGLLPPVEELKHVLNARLDHLLTALETLVQCGLIDALEGRYYPHNWEKYQMKSDSSTERVRAWKQKRNVAGNVAATVHDTKRYESIPDTNVSGPLAPPVKPPDVELFERGKKVLGQSAGGMIKKLVDAKNGSVELARAAVEVAATKSDPREYIGAILKGGNQQAAIRKELDLMFEDIAKRKGEANVH